jgi:uncharacterized protein YeaC (DUF1315 family)
MEKMNKYKLDSSFYHEDETQKHQIILMDSANKGMNHLNIWEGKSSCEEVGYKKTSPYSIDLDGTIYEHYDSKYYSTVFGLKDVDEKLIPITLVNEGCLSFSGKKKEFITWWGDIYGRGKDEVYMEKWRGGVFWAPYTEPQIESLVSLIVKLSKKHNIEMRVRNIDIDSDFVSNYLGITTKSDYSILNQSINPSFDRIKFKEKIENYEK